MRLFISLCVFLICMCSSKSSGSVCGDFSRCCSGFWV